MKNERPQVKNLSVRYQRQVEENCLEERWERTGTNINSFIVVLFLTWKWELIRKWAKNVLQLYFQWVERVHLLYVSQTLQSNILHWCVLWLTIKVIIYSSWFISQCSQQMSSIPDWRILLARILERNLYWNFYKKLWPFPKVDLLILWEVFNLFSRKQIHRQKPFLHLPANTYPSCLFKPYSSE